MRRWIYFLYGVGCHLLFLGTFAYMIGFVGNLIVPSSIDSNAGGSVASALLVNTLLLCLFALQHSIMARPGFKRIWTRVVPEVIERSTYVLASCLFTLLVMWQWQGIDLVIWNIETSLLRYAMWGLFAAGWLMVPLVSLAINHFDLFGTRQVWLNLKGRKYTALTFREPFLYKQMRHPLYVGWALAMWATPTMTLGHLLFASVLTLYMMVAVVFEERDLVAHLGSQYEEYCRRVPKFIPRLRNVSFDSVEKSKS